jgi:hypothetical protein
LAAPVALPEGVRGIDISEVAGDLAGELVAVEALEVLFVGERA